MEHLKATETLFAIINQTRERFECIASLAEKRATGGSGSWCSMCGQDFAQIARLAREQTALMQDAPVREILRQLNQLPKSEEVDTRSVK